MSVRLTLRSPALALALALMTTGVEAAVSVRAGFKSAVIAGNLIQPTAMAIAPDGRLFICQQTGALRVVKNGQLLAAPFVTVAVDPSGERGLLGVALDPMFAVNHYVYIYYTTTTTPRRNRVSRFTANGDVALAGSEVVLLELNALSGATNHNGGALNFGPDGYLYVAVGDNASGSNAQSLSNLLGKILRIADDGSIPADNPFFSIASGVNRAIWALGLRNPFTFTFQPGTGLMYINDVGQNTFEEINEGAAGANYGWPLSEGPTSTSGQTGPLYWYGHGSGPQLGCAITGGAFYNPQVQQFPAGYVGDYFFGDYCGNWITVRDALTGAVSTFASGVLAPVDLDLAADGSLYYLSRGSGHVARISYVPPIASFTSTTPMPHRVGAPVSWKATVQGAVAPVEYQFWLYSSPSGQWTSTSYSSSNTFTFTPLQTGSYILQVWVRNVGSTNAFDSYRSSGTFAVLPAPMTITSLSANQQQPFAAGAPSTWTAAAVGGTGAPEFRYWLYSVASGMWTMVRDYAASPSWTWMPAAAGQYAVQVWGRSNGSTADYNAFRGTSHFTVVPAMPAKPMLTVSPALPVPAGHVLQWTAKTTGGRQPLQYQFWLFSQRTGTWSNEQAWSAGNTWTWRPIEPGSYQLQVWVRSAGSTAAYEAWSSRGTFTILSAPVAAHSVSVFPAFPAAPGTLAQFTAVASGGTPPLQYQFWGLSGGSWTMLRDYDPDRTFTWALSEGTHAVEAWVRSTGSTAAREAFATTATFDVASRQAAVRQVAVNQTFPLPTSTPIVWTVTATGGMALLQYQFWRFTAGQWHLAQAWSSSNRLMWTPTNADVGTHSFQVWVRATGSPAAYDAWAPFGPVDIVP